MCAYMSHAFYEHSLLSLVRATFSLLMKDSMTSLRPCCVCMQVNCSSILIEQREEERASHVQEWMDGEDKNGRRISMSWNSCE